MMGLFGLSLAYHSFSLFILYLIATVLFVIVAGQFSTFAEMFLIVAAAPSLAIFSLAGFSLSLEFSVIFIAPLLLKGKKIGVTVALACLWCVVCGIIARYEFMGSLIVGIPRYMFYTLGRPPALFYDLSWFHTGIGVASINGNSFDFNHLGNLPNSFTSIL